MGQKTHPIGFRTGVTKDWRSRWFAEGRDYGETVLEDVRIRRLIGERLANAGLEEILIERSLGKIVVTVHVARPGVAIGRGGASINSLREELRSETDSKLKLDVEEVKEPRLSARIMAGDIARRIERRMRAIRVMSRAASEVMDAGAGGIKITCSGVLGGASSIGRSITVSEGSVPASTLRADIDYALDVAKTLYGTIGVKVWINRAEKLKTKS